MNVMTKDVDTLLGNPKRAMLAIAVPVIISMVVQNANNLIDTAWVSGLGTNALSAVGFVFPLFYIITSIGNAIGIGSSSAISRLIGQGDHESANRAAGQAIILTIIISIVLAIIFVLTMDPLFTVLGAGQYVQDCIEYFLPLIITMPIVLVGIVMANILRSEGASKKAMYSQILAAVINIILDPFFIYDYGLGLGLAGAAWATGISMSVSTALLIYWYFFQKKTYLRIDFNRFRLDWKLDAAIIRVGFPASLEVMVVVFVTMISYVILAQIDPDNGVAIYSSTWKIIQFIMIPYYGMGAAIIPVCAAAYGLRYFENIKESYRYSILMITVVMAVVLLIVFLTSEYIVSIFTYGDSTAALKSDMAFGLRISCLFIIFLPWGYITGAFFQSLGMGFKSLISTTMRNSLLLVIAGPLGIICQSMEMFWVGVTIAEIVGTLIIGMWGVIVLRSLLKQGREGTTPHIRD